MKLRRTLAALAATTAALGTVIATPSDAHPATAPVVTGNGWKINAARGITHIDTANWTIAFHDATSRTKLTPYVKNTATELASYLGVKFTVTTRIVPATQGACPSGHVISLRYMSKPVPDYPRRSISYSCGTPRLAADGSYIFINADYWTAAARLPEYSRMNMIWHEMGHAVGLAHPDTCPYNSTGIKPIMCSTVSGYHDLRTRRYTSWERTGFRQLIANRAYALPALAAP
ncbi:hypothetical protein [Streptomyces sp. NPDC046862]|uniref:hypothetical protein n=1 Tax=Streptomyces sp. NPDC046862 TaxID=3154603 RepID=UPI0034566DF9